MKSFALGRYEVTFVEYAQFALASGLGLPVDSGFGKGRRPVINVSWDEAAAMSRTNWRKNYSKWVLSFVVLMIVGLLGSFVNYETYDDPNIHQLELPIDRKFF